MRNFRFTARQLQGYRYFLENCDECVMNMYHKQLHKFSYMQGCSGPLFKADRYW